MAIAQAVLTVIKEENLQQHANLLGEHLLQGLRSLQTKHPTHIGDVRLVIELYRTFMIFFPVV